MRYSYLLNLYKASDDTLISGWTNISTTGFALNVTGLVSPEDYYYRITKRYTSIYGNYIDSTPSIAMPVSTLDFSDTITNLNANHSLINYDSFQFNFSREPLATYTFTLKDVSNNPVGIYDEIVLTGSTVALTGLVDNTPYQPYLAISYNDLLEEYLSGTITTPDLIAPVNVTGSTITATGYTATWTAVSGVTEYEIDVSLNNFSSNLTNYNGLRVTGTSLAITGLTELTEYKHRMRSIFNNLESDNSSVATTTTISAVVVPDVPTGLTVNSYTNTTADISWDSVVGADDYRLYIYIGGVAISGYNGKVITLTNESVTGLIEGTNYTVKVSACNDSGCSALSTEVAFTTKYELILYSTNSSVRNYIRETNFAKSFDTKLTTNNSNVESRVPSDGKISPNGRYIAYTEVVSGRDAIMIWDRQNNTSTNLTNNTSFTYVYPCWQANNNDEVFYINDNGSTYAQVEKVNISTFTKTVLKVGTVNSIIRNIVFNPDGLYLYLNLQDFSNNNWYIGKLDVSSWANSITTFVSLGINFPMFEMFWKPDGSKLAFSSYDASNSGVSQIFEVNSDGTSKTQRTVSGLDRRCPVYSPDGSKILFRETSGSDSYIIEADTTYSSGYFANQNYWYNSSGNYSDAPLEWKLV